MIRISITIANNKKSLTIKIYLHVQTDRYTDRPDRQTPDRQKHIVYLKAQIFLFFSEDLSMWNQITNKNTDNSAT